MNRRDTEIVKRARVLASGKRGSGPVIYWMYRDQRIQDNWAFLYALEEAKVRQTHLLVIFFYEQEFLPANVRQVERSKHGLLDIQKSLEEKNIPFICCSGNPSKRLPQIIAQCDGTALVTDFSPLQQKKRLNQKLVEVLTTPFIEVDAHNIIPAWEISNKKEYAAYTLRPKIHRALHQYLTEFPQADLFQQRDEQLFKLSQAFDNSSYLLDAASTSSPPCEAAIEHMQNFIAHRLSLYADKRNDPNEMAQSDLSPYLHLGQLSAQRLALEVSKSKNKQENKDDFLEELIVRRELSDNFCLYEENYDTFDGFHEWAQKTLAEHKKDKRQYLYKLEQFDTGNTHDQLWNGCQRDLVERGKLHGYLRMYWAKKILEWTPDAQTAQDYAIYLNDRYSIDGNDPNGFTGVAWSIGGVHDRAWPERPVFGKIRYMNDAGCKRKFDVKKYIDST